MNKIKVLKPVEKYRFKIATITPESARKNLKIKTIGKGKFLSYRIIFGSTNLNFNCEIILEKISSHKRLGPRTLIDFKNGEIRSKTKN